MLRRFSKKRSSSKPSNPQTSESKALLSKFLEFITSSIWSIPIASFIEQQSIVFDRQQMEVEVYEQIHKEYASLIDTLIECFCEDVSTSASNLTEALKLLQQKNLSLRQKVSLEPLAAAQDFNVFVPMMMRKNIELQLQALQMIEFMCGLIPAVLQIEDGETLQNRKELSPEDTERYVLISVLRQSRDEFEAMQKGREEMEFLAREGEQQRMRLEDEIRKEERLLQMALANRNMQQEVENETPLSVAAIMYSQMTDSSTNTEQGTSSGTMTNSTSSTIGISTDRSRPTTAKHRETRSTNTVLSKEMGTDSMRPDTAKRQNSETGARMASASTGVSTADVGMSARPTTGKRQSSKETGTDSTNTQDRGTRPMTGKGGSSKGTGADSMINQTSETEDQRNTGNHGIMTDSNNTFESGNGISDNRPKTGSRRGSRDIPTDTKQNSRAERPGTAKRTGSKSNMTASVNIEDIETEILNADRPVTGKRRDSKGTGTDFINKEDAETGMSRPGTTKRSNSGGTGTDKIDSQNMGTETSFGSRPGTGKRRDSKGTGTSVIEKEDAETGMSRPGSTKRNNSEGTETEKIDKREMGTETSKSVSRPGTAKQRRGSKEIGTDNADATGKSKDSERPRTKSKTRSGDSKKPPLGPVREPKYPKEMGEERKYVETPGMEHGPRRKNLNDVNSHLVDRDRLNSSDVRARAEYLREQRDKLLQLKREERMKQMNELTKNPSERPKTAQAARGMMDKKEAEEIRREINQKIKTEILTLQ